VEIDRALASNEALGVALLVVLFAIGWANRVFFRDIAHDDDRFWRIMPRAALAIALVFVAWTSVADNWRQLTGLPYRLTQRFPSQRVEYNPPSDDVRTVSVILLALSLIVVACLVARHVGGYAVQMILLVGALFFWLPIFTIRLRFNVSLAFGFEGSLTSPLDVLGYVLYVVLAWLVDIALILVSFVALLAAIALPVTLLLDLTRLRRPKMTTEAASFFASLAERAGSAGHQGLS